MEYTIIFYLIAVINFLVIIKWLKECSREMNKQECKLQMSWQAVAQSHHHFTLQSFIPSLSKDGLLKMSKEAQNHRAGNPQCQAQE